MDRRDSLKALGVMLAGASVSPVMAHEAERVEMVILKLPYQMNQEEMERLRAGWERACQGTAFDGVRTVVLPPGMDVEFVRK